MTKLVQEMKKRKILIKELAKILNMSDYGLGQKIKRNHFNTQEIDILLEYFDMKYEDLFVNNHLSI